MFIFVHLPFFFDNKYITRILKLFFFPMSIEIIPLQRLKSDDTKKIIPLQRKRKDKRARADSVERKSEPGCEKRQVGRR